MSQFTKVLGNLRDALARGAAPQTNGRGADSPALPAATVARRAELAARFMRELEAVGGKAIAASSAPEAAERIADLAREAAVDEAAIGEAGLTDFAPIELGLRGAGVAVMRIPQAYDDAARIAIRARLERCAMGIAEANCAIASSGTLGVISTATRPSSLTLLPPHSVIVVHVDRIVADLAAALSVLGADVIRANRLTLITGPSRTADIEKRIVLGVHGPKRLDAIVIWPGDD